MSYNEQLRDRVLEDFWCLIFTYKREKVEKKTDFHDYIDKSVKMITMDTYGKNTGSI
jgi:hypothetical protein